LSKDDGNDDEQVVHNQQLQNRQTGYNDNNNEDEERKRDKDEGNTIRGGENYQSQKAAGLWQAYNKPARHADDFFVDFFSLVFYHSSQLLSSLRFSLHLSSALVLS
jgi:hypothetical protein